MTRPIRAGQRLLGRPKWPAARSRVLKAGLWIALALGEPLLLGPRFSEPAVSLSSGGVVRVRELQPGLTVEAEIQRGELHVYRISLQPGQVLVGEIATGAPGISIALLPKLGEPLLDLDSPGAGLPPEPLLAVAQVAGEHRLVITARDPGRYRLHMGTPHLPGEGEILRATATRHLSYAFRALRYAKDEQAAGEFRAALQLWRPVEDWRERALAQAWLGQAEERLGHYAASRELYSRALADLRGDRRAEAFLTEGIARDLYQLQEYEQAIASGLAAVKLFSESGDRRGEAEALGNLALTYKTLGDIQEALDLDERSLALWKDLADLEQQATLLHNVGQIYLDMGHPKEALEQFEQALRLDRKLPDALKGEALTVGAEGMAHFELHEIDQALSLVSQGVDLARRTGERWDLALALIRQGVMLLDVDRVQEARPVVEDAVAIASEADQRMESYAIALQARMDDLLGKKDEARRLYQRALTFFEKSKDLTSQARALYGLALLERGAGDLQAARAAIEGSLELTEELRKGTASLELRSGFLAEVRKRYELAIDLLMELHRGDPTGGFDIEAFEMSERARARAVLDELAATGEELRAGADPRLLKRERELRREIRALTERGQAAADGDPGSERLSELRARLDQIEADIRVSNPHTARLQPQPRTLAEIQREILDDGSVLLAYFLGDTRSFLWRIGRRSFKAYELPGRKEIEDESARLLASLRQSEGSPLEAMRAAESLSETLLGRVAGTLGRSRLVFVVDGPLQGLPFAALPEPAAEGEKKAPRGPFWFLNALVVQHEIVSIPSASALALLRQERAGRRPAPYLLAVLADAVVGRDDKRLPPPHRQEPGDLQRLRSSGTEIEVLRKLAPDQSLVARGFDANLEMATSPILGRYKYLYFGVHAELREQPERSGLILSRYDKAGNQHYNVLTSLDIYGLDLPVEMVVLGACQTGQAAVDSGEGMGHLARGFLHAGAKRVVVSLWNVSDEATAQLMKHFYTGLLQKGLPPAEALRQAQLSIASEREWAAPYYWAGFVLQGDWK